MTVEFILAFCVGVFAIFVGGIILIVRFMINRLIQEHEKELHRAFIRGYDKGIDKWLEGNDEHQVRY